MAQAKKGDRIRFDFTGRLEDGTVFDSTLEAELNCDDDCHDEECGDDCGCESGPVELVIGEGKFFPQVEEALVGMAPGETKSVTVPCAEAFGDYDEEMVFTVERSQLPDDFVAEEGDELVLTDENDEPHGVSVLEMDEQTVTFDGNHPLAGEDLTFELQLVEIL